MIKNMKSFVSGMCETNSYILSDEDNNCVIFDPEGSSAQYINYIKANNLKPLAIMLTHAHFDHVGAMEALKKEYGIEVIAGEDEKPVLENPSINLTTMIGTAKSYSADRYVKDGEEVELGKMKFKVIFTPGYTCGSVCYICGDTMISGDTLFMGSCGRTDFPTGDWKQMTESLKLLKNLDGDYKVYSGHGPSTTLERERKTNMYMR